jgi:hypothetical protein
MGLGNRGRRRGLIHKVGLQTYAIGKFSPSLSTNILKLLLRYPYFKEFEKRVFSNSRETD